MKKGTESKQSAQTGHVNVDGDDAVGATQHGVRVVVVAAAVRAAAHRQHPLGSGHLVVYFAQRGRHLVGHRAGDDDAVRLTRRRTEDDAEPVHVVARARHVHHFHRATGQPERQRPERVLKKIPIN